MVEFICSWVNLLSRLTFLRPVSLHYLPCPDLGSRIQLSLCSCRYLSPRLFFSLLSLLPPQHLSLMSRLLQQNLTPAPRKKQFHFLEFTLIKIPRVRKWCLFLNVYARCTLRRPTLSPFHTCPGLYNFGLMRRKRVIKRT